MDQDGRITSAAIILNGDDGLHPLLIGNQASAADLDFFKVHNIKTVVNATRHLPFIPQDKLKLVRIQVPVNDPGPMKSLTEENVAIMNRALSRVVDMVHESRKHGAVLVHCHAGAQRSAAICTAYMAKYYFNHGPKKMAETYDRSVAWVLKCRPRAFYHGAYVNFKQAIKRYIAGLDK